MENLPVESLIIYMYC